MILEKVLAQDLLCSLGKLCILAVSFYNCISWQHSNIKSIMETGKDDKFPFFNILVCNKPDLVTCL